MTNIIYIYYKMLFVKTIERLPCVFNYGTIKKINATDNYLRVMH